MQKHQQKNRKVVRTKTQICKDFVRYLAENKIITPEEIPEMLQDEKGTLLFLDELLYETEEIQGVLCSTLRAWQIWVTVVLRYEPRTGVLLYNRFVENVFLDIEHHRYTCILSSRGCGKSYFVYGLYSIFKMYLYQFTNIVICANVPRMCKRNIRDASKSLIDTNELLLEKKEFEKGKELIWTQDAIEYNGGILETVSVGANVRSAHVNYVFADDLLRDDAKYSDEEVMNFFFGQLFPIAQTHKARMVITGTPLHTKDLYHYIMNEQPEYMGKRITYGAYSHNSFWSKDYPIIRNWETKEILLPEKFTWWELVDEKNPQSLIRTQGQTKFMREYMLVCTDSSTSIFPEKLIKACQDPDLKFLYRGEKHREYLMGVDVATAGAASADYSVFVILELQQTEFGTKKFLRHITRVKGMPITGEKDQYGELLTSAVPGQVDTIKNLANLFNQCPVVVEKNNVGVALIQELQKRNVNVDEFITSQQSKNNLIRYLVSEMKSGNLIFPEDCAEIRMLKQELMNYGVKRTRTNKEKLGALSGHDDTVIALAIANLKAQDIGGCAFAILQD